MSVSLPKLHVGDPLRHEALTVFPLYSDPSGDVEYRLADEAIADESLLVEEVDQSGSVPDLLVENKGDLRVLFLEGQELIGAKQNRILNTSVLVAAHSKIKIPVSCVEQGRWRHTSKYFGSSGSHSPTKLRRALKASVSRSVQKRKSYASDQGAVWESVSCLMASHGVSSGTEAMSDAFVAYEDEIATYRQRIPYAEGAVGVAVAVGDRIASIDVFDKPATCRKVWERLLTGVVFDALEAGKADKTADTHDVERLLTATGDLAWRQSQPVGEGEEYRAESGRGDHASALALDNTVVHGSVVAAV